MKTATTIAGTAKALVAHELAHSQLRYITNSNPKGLEFE
jgi:hypothetical protein